MRLWFTASNGYKTHARKSAAAWAVLGAILLMCAPGRVRAQSDDDTLRPSASQEEPGEESSSARPGERTRPAGESLAAPKTLEFAQLAEELSGKFSAALEGWRDARGAAHRPKVLVLDFRTWDDRWLPFGAWLADKVSATFSGYGGTFDAIDRAKLAAALKSKHMLPGDEIESRRLTDLTEYLRADILVRGKYSAQGDDLGLAVNAVPALVVEYPRTIFSVKYKLVMSQDVAQNLVVGLDLVGPKRSESLAGWNGVTLPKCLDCPAPPKTRAGKKDWIYGTTVLLLLITPDGRVSDVRVTRPLDPILDQQVIETVKTWKFEPATDSKGQPVAVHTAAEMSYKP